MGKAMRNWSIIRNIAEQEKKEFIISCLSDYITTARRAGIENLYPAVQEVIDLYKEIIKLLRED